MQALLAPVQMARGLGVRMEHNVFDHTPGVLVRWSRIGQLGERKIKNKNLLPRLASEYYKK